MSLHGVDLSLRLAAWRRLAPAQPLFAPDPALARLRRAGRQRE